MLRYHKYILGVAIACFIVSAVIRIDTGLVGLLFDIQEDVDETISWFASLFGAFGGIFIALYYIIGFFFKKALEEDVNNED